MGFGVKTLAKSALRFIKTKDVVPIDHVVSERQILEGKVALISGGSGGIGMAIAKQFYNAGALIVLGGTDASKLQRCAEEIGPKTRVKAVLMDISNPNRAEQAVSEAMRMFGRIDIFVNSSGVHTNNVDLWNMTPEEFDRVFSINLRGAFFAGRAAANHMIEAGIKGHILFINSSRGFEPAWSPYGISKWGLRGMTQGFAQKLLPYGITVNGIAPGSTATSLIGVADGDSIDSQENGVGRLALPDEIATWALMLVSSFGDMVVGETVLVSGGRGSIDIR
ncbi:SDR family NAD(P)-dependent oxidoreductase [Collinsella intestinalis]|uniref:SDR family NAD(P)-dependent oxidoreductase n=1 Tax=Collinsella intestinalis TaxID=147207 RepID=UPI0019574A27|nr:SDR family oxidoreductase [Collinsella intestinalis]MBM6683709.1 SDR family oxidoreductase [Collinsella intestinalis]